MSKGLIINIDHIFMATILEFTLFAPMLEFKLVMAGDDIRLW